MKIKALLNSEETFDVESTKSGYLLNGKETTFQSKKIKENIFEIRRESKLYQLVIVSREPDYVTLNINGHQITVSVKDDLAQMLDKLGIEDDAKTELKEILAPMPGLILDIPITEGQEIAEKQTVLILEAMKMENIIKSPIASIVKKIHVTKGQNVEKNQVLISF
ncbi:MAG: biotin carboxyl carrier protein [Marinoscillum sp.]|jgi:biotin carboxyl carrier protein